jgi:hypothetical protein
MSKPSEFYVGVIDLFAILLPGAIAAALLAPWLGPRIFGPLVAVPGSEAARWAAFLLCAYSLGHLIFLVGSYIDLLYNILRERYRPYGNESAYQCAARIRDGLIPESERKALNPFQWSRSVLLARCPLAAEDVHRLEADSKFFRSLLVVSLPVGLVFLFTGRITEGLVALVLMGFCFARYYERRLKSTTQAYIHIISLHRLGLLTGDASADRG